MSGFERWERGVRFTRDLLVALGVPALVGLFWTLHNAQVDALREQIASLKETQFPRVAEIVEAQRRLYERERWVVTELAKDVRKLASDIEVGSQPVECNAEIKKILGKDCDFGDYMEWAVPELLDRADRLTRLLGAPGGEGDDTQ